MEEKTNNKQLKLSSPEVNKQSEAVLSIKNLPEEIFINIFKYLKYEELCRIGRVCKQWHSISRCPVFWRRVDIQFSRKSGSMSDKAMKFVKILPPSVTHLRISFESWKKWTLNFTEMLKKLQERCPNLQVLVLHRARLSTTDNSQPDISLCEKMLGNIRALALHHSVLKNDRMLRIINGVNSKIETLDISRSYRMSFEDSFLSKAPHLKKLRLAGSGIPDFNSKISPSVASRLEVLDLEGALTGSVAFGIVRKYGLHLVELYMCFTVVEDNDLVFNNEENVLPCLKIVCVRATNVTHKGVASLAKSCQSLTHIYVGRVLYSTDHSIYNSEKVRVIDGFAYCDHYAKIDHMHL